MQNKLIIFLSILVLLLSGYLFYDSVNSGELPREVIQTEFNDLKTDYELIQNDLELSVNNQMISNKIIETQQQKIENLLRKNAITEEELFEAKKLMREISQSVLNEYQRRVAGLEKEKIGLITDQKEEEDARKQLQARIRNLEKANAEINTKYSFEKKEALRKENLLAYASKLSVSNFVLNGYRVRSSGKEIETDRASRIDRLKISFDILENKIVETGRKELFIIAKKPDGSLLSIPQKSSGSILVDGNRLSVTDRVFVNYIKGQQKNVEVIWDSEEFVRGDYVLEVYEKGSAGNMLVGKATKTLQ